MLQLNFMKPAGLTLVLLTAILGLIVLNPGSVWASSYTVYVPSPSGGDDTTVLQAALDDCMNNHPTGCTIQLSTGVYKSKQLLIENFNGSLRGLGMDVTSIDVLAPLEVTISDQNYLNLPPSRNNKYPMLLIFMGGDITVSDMTFKVSDPSPVKPWCHVSGCGQTWLEGLMGVISSSANLLVQRVGFEGVKPGLGMLDGRNYNNGAFFSGFSRDEPVTGTFKVVSSRFRYAGNGFEPGWVRNGQITIGGSPADGNVVEDAMGGLIFNLGNSSVEYAYNNVTVGGTFAPGVFLYQRYLPIQAPSQYLVHHNIFRATGGLEDGVLIVDEIGDMAKVVVTDNTIQLGGSEVDPAWAGIETLFTVDTVISNNRISGKSVLFGIAIEAGSQCMLQGNDLQQLHALWAPIALLGVSFGLPDTSYCTVVGGNNRINVYDEGTNNTLVGVNNMQGNPPGPALKEAMQQRLELLKSRVR